MRLKLCITYIAILICTKLSIAQESRFPLSNASWCYNQYTDNGHNQGDFCVMFIDSIAQVDGNSYNIIDTKGKWGLPKFQLIREEDNKVYINNEELEAEILLYDFNLEIGDTYLANYGFGINDPIELTVKQIDTIQTMDGLSRKLFSLESSDSSRRIEWIEGIGDKFWLFYYPAYTGSVSGGFSFLCFTIGDMIIYNPSCQSGPCGVMSNARINNKRIIDIYPNPTTEEITININAPDVIEYEIINSRGSIIKHVRIQSNGKTHMLTIIEKGLYILRYKTSNRGYGFEKIIVY